MLVVERPSPSIGEMVMEGAKKVRSLFFPDALPDPLMTPDERIASLERRQLQMELSVCAFVITLFITAFLVRRS